MNYYEILRVPKTASLVEIKKAYRKLVKRYHPDTYEGNKSFADSKMKEITEAYDILSNEKTKEKYDSELNYKNYSVAQEEYVTKVSRADVANYKKVYTQYTYRNNVNSAIKKQKKITHSLDQKFKNLFFRFDKVFDKDEKEDIVIMILFFSILIISLNLVHILF